VRKLDKVATEEGKNHIICTFLNGKGNAFVTRARDTHDGTVVGSNRMGATISSQKDGERPTIAKTLTANIADMALVGGNIFNIRMHKSLGSKWNMLVTCSKTIPSNEHDAIQNNTLVNLHNKNTSTFAMYLVTYKYNKDAHNTLVMQIPMPNQTKYVTNKQGTIFWN
jgi:hypothetical protein